MYGFSIAKYPWSSGSGCCVRISLRMQWGRFNLQISHTFPLSFPELYSTCEVVKCSVEFFGMFLDSLWREIGHHPITMRVLDGTPWSSHVRVTSGSAFCNISRLQAVFEVDHANMFQYVIQYEADCNILHISYTVMDFKMADDVTWLSWIWITQKLCWIHRFWWVLQWAMAAALRQTTNSWKLTKIRGGPNQGKNQGRRGFIWIHAETNHDKAWGQQYQAYQTNMKNDGLRCQLWINITEACANMSPRLAKIMQGCSGPPGAW